MDKTDLLARTVAENACRAVEYHADVFNVSDLTRIERIIAGQKNYNELYDVCPIEVDGVLFSTADGLNLTGGERLVRHPSGTVTAEDARVMKVLILAGIKPSDLLTAASS